MKPLNNHPYYQITEDEIKQLDFANKSPASLYQPLHYTLQAGGKRIRPALLLAAAEMFGMDPKLAAKQACAIELFHNFTLIHDDVMDNASLRRGRPTVFKKYGLNSALLGGDVMLVKSYELLSNCKESVLKAVNTAFNEMAVRVYEGQKLDVDFETRNNVSAYEYVLMIQGKTAVLLGAALKIGAICAGAPVEDAEKLYTVGLELGTAFQIFDDLLDIFGNTQETGKMVGGDILASKKTYPIIVCLETAEPQDRTQLLEMLYNSDLDDEIRISESIRIFRKYNVESICKLEAVNRHELALNLLNAVNAPKEKKEFIEYFAEMLLQRTH